MPEKALTELSGPILLCFVRFTPLSIRKSLKQSYEFKTLIDIRVFEWYTAFTKQVLPVCMP